MATTITSINAGSNCYLLETSGSFVLVDTGVRGKRRHVEDALTRAGCSVGDLKLIVLTHGDSDHADNAAFLRAKFSAPIAMHRADAGMVERGDMSSNRKARPDKVTLMGRVIMVVGKLVVLVQPPRFDTFSPDIAVEDGQSLSGYGLDASVLQLPGHSQGSIGVFTADGSLCCGDLIYNFFRPSQDWIDDLAAAKRSIARLQTLNPRVVYPGHGKPFLWGKFASRQR